MRRRRRMRRFQTIDITCAALSGTAAALGALGAVVAADDVPLTSREFATVVVAAGTAVILAVLCWMERRRVQRDQNMTLLIRTLPAVSQEPGQQPGRPALRRSGDQPVLRVVSSR